MNMNDVNERFKVILFVVLAVLVIIYVIYAIIRGILALITLYKINKNKEFWHIKRLMLNNH